MGRPKKKIVEETIVKEPIKAVELKAPAKDSRDDVFTCLLDETTKLINLFDKAIKENRPMARRLINAKRQLERLTRELR